MTTQSDATPRRRPWLYVSSGKFGQQSGTLLKAALINQYGAMPAWCKILVVDSAPQVPPIEISGRSVSLTTNEEFIKIGDVELQSLWQHREDHPALNQYFELLKSTPAQWDSLADGAGQNRVLFMLAFAHHWKERIDPALRRCLADLVAAHRVDWERTPGVLVGGDGWGAHASGGMLPWALGVRSAAGNLGMSLDGAPFWGFAALPGGSRQGNANSEVNAYGLLTELRAAQQTGGLRMPLPGNITAECLGQPFDYIVLAGVQGRDNSRLSSSDQLVEMLAEVATLIVGSTIGDAQRTFARDQRDALKRHGVKGDITCFSAQNVVAAQYHRNDLAEYLEQTAVAQAAESLLAPQTNQTTLDVLARVTQASAPSAALAAANGRSFLPDLQTELQQALLSPRIPDKKVSARLRELSAQLTNNRMPAVKQRAGERATTLWNALRQDVDSEAVRLLNAGYPGAACGFLAAALEAVSTTRITAARVDDAQKILTVRETELEAAVNRFALSPGRKDAIQAATIELIKAHAGIFQTRAEVAGAEALLARRDAERPVLTVSSEKATTLLGAVTSIAATSRTRAAAALDRAVRDRGTTTETDMILRYRVLAEADARRAYAETYFGSSPEALSDDAAGVLIPHVRTLSPLLGKDEDAVRAHFLGAVTEYASVWRERTIEDILRWLGDGAQRVMLSRLQTLAVERLAYSAALFQDGALPHQVLILGVPNRETTTLAGQIDAEVVSTGDPERVVLSRLTLGIPATALRQWDALERAARDHPEHPLHNLPHFPPPETEHVEEDEEADAATPLPIGVEGSPAFERSVARVFGLLRERTPKRHREAKALLPKVVLDPERLKRESPGAYARSDGVFSHDGSGSKHDQDFFLFAFLHEVGHNFHMKRSHDPSEASADDYANTVFKELGYRFGWRQDVAGVNQRFEYAIPVPFFCGGAVDTAPMSRLAE